MSSFSFSEVDFEKTVIFTVVVNNLKAFAPDFCLVALCVITLACALPLQVLRGALETTKDSLEQCVDQIMKVKNIKPAKDPK